MAAPARKQPEPRARSRGGTAAAPPRGADQLIAREVGVWRWEVSADRIEASTRFCALFKLAARKPIDLATLLAAGWESDRAAAEIALRKAASRYGARCEFQLRVGAAGAARTVLFRGQSEGKRGGSRCVAGIAVSVATVATEQPAPAERGEAPALQQALAASGAIIWEVRPDTGEVRCSENARGIWGRVAGPSEAFFACIHPDDRDEVRRQSEAALRGEGRYEQEYRVRAPDGAIRWLHCRGDLVLDDAGKPVRFAGVSVEITERKGAELALRESHEELRRAQEAARTAQERLLSALQGGRMMVWELDLESGITVRRGPVRAVIGEVEDTGAAYLARVHPDDRPQLEAAVRAVERGEASLDCEYRFNKSDGTTVWLHDFAQLRRDAQGRPASVAGVCMDVSARKQAEQALVEVQVRERAYLEHLPVGVWFLDAEGRITYGNPAGRQIWAGARYVGIDQFGEYKGWRHGSDVPLAPDEWAAARAVRNGEASLDELIDIQCFDGTRKTILNSAVPVRDQHGRITGATVFNQDVTARIAANAALRVSEERFRAIFEMAGVSIWEEDFATVKAELDALGCTGVTDFRAYFAEHPDFVERAIAQVRVRDVNPATLRLFGANSRDELMASLTLIFLPETRAVFVEELVAIAERRQFLELEAPLKTLRGERIDVLFTLVLPVATERFERVLVTLTDVTARKQAIDALRESEARFRTMADSTPVMIWVTDATGACTYLNRRWYEFTGDTEAHSLGFGWLERVHPDDRRISESTFAAANARRERFRLEYRLRRADGEYRWAIDAAEPRFGAAGEFLGFIGSVIDITERKLAEVELADARERLQRHATELERIVDERTAELRATNEQLETFVYSVAHDLRAPLRSITGFSQLLQEEHANALDENGRRMLQRVQASSEFMDKLLLDLLAFGRTARAAIELTAVPVARAWEAARFQCASQIEETYGVVEAVGELGTVRAHEATLGQTLANLLSNALKFMAPGVRPHVRLVAEERGTKVRLWVEDNGIGIPREQLDRVFRVFERLHGNRYAGTGIGLSIVRKGAERMGGTAGVESEPGRGSRFWIELAKASPEATT